MMESRKPENLRSADWDKKQKLKVTQGLAALEADHLGPQLDIGTLTVVDPARLSRLPLQGGGLAAGASEARRLAQDLLRARLAQEDAAARLEARRLHKSREAITAPAMISRQATMTVIVASALPARISSTVESSGEA